VDVSPHASRVSFKRATERQRLLAATRDGRVGKTLELLTPREAFGDGMAFPGPLVLPYDDLAEDPEWPPQDLREWRSEEERNPVTRGRKTIYIVPSPAISPEVSKMQTWSICSTPTATAEREMQAAEPPKIQHLMEYLSAFFHGMPVKLFKAPFQWQKWNKYDGAILTSPSAQRRIGLRTPGDRLFGIRCRASPDELSPMQVNLDDVLDALAENIPADAHSIMMLLDLDMYEGDGDIFTAGRAYGGSRIAAVSLFRDQPLCAPPDDGHAWPASHCAEYIDKLCLEASDEPPTKKKAKLQLSSRCARTGTSGPLDRAIEAVQTTAAAAAEASSSGISRQARLDAAASTTAQWLGRTAVTMAHELCHCLGLDHCTYFACAMQGCGSVAEAQRQPPYVCPVCLEKICWAIGEGVVDGWEEEDRGVRDGFVRERYGKLREVCERWGGGMFVGYKAWLDDVLEGNLESRDGVVKLC
jgi:archaemetzincin